MKIAIHRSPARAALAVLLCCALGGALGETSTVIDPTEGLEPPKAPLAAPKRAAAPDAAVKRERERQRAEAAEKERARLRVLEQARLAEAAAREAAAREAVAKKAAAVKAAVARTAARATARLVAQQVAAREAAAREAAALEIAAREAAAREAAARELAAREAAAKEAAAREAAAKEAAARAAAVKEVTDRLIVARQAGARDNGVKLIAAGEAQREPRMLKGLGRSGSVFRDCADCPELVWLPPGQFAIGDASVEGGARPKVVIQYPLAVGRFEVTFAEWDACVADNGCRRRPYDAGWGRGWQPVINVSWTDAQQYAAWLSRKTSRRYRLLTEAEWEYAARAGTDARYWWGDQPGRGEANCADCGSKWDGRQAAPVGRFAPNPFGLYDMHGNVAEWVEDCYHDRLREMPVDGRAWNSACSATPDTRTLRGGAWHASARSARSSFRTSAALDHFDNGIGFRVARSE